MRLDDLVALVRWHVVIPVKRLSTAKSRLSAPSGTRVDELALAFFQDTARAVLHTPEVASLIIATSDPRAQQWAHEQGCPVVDDTDHPGINAAARAAAPLAGPRLAVMVSDLPCATPAAISAALAGCPVGATAVVSDAAGTGSTMWLGPADRAADLRFGPHSRTNHIATGAVDLVDLLPDGAVLETVRRDVDTEADLADALRLGVGPHTARALHHVSR